MFFDVLKLLEKKVNFTTSLLKRLDGNWGKFNHENGTWNGMIKSLLDGEADLIATSLTVNPERFAVVDHLYPMGTETYSIYIG